MADEQNIRSILRQRSRSDASFSLDTSRGVVIYGAGIAGADALEVLQKHGIHVRGFLDIKAQPDATFLGYPVYHPDNRGQEQMQWQKSIVVLAVFNPEANIHAIELHLTELGYGQIIPFPLFHRRFADDLGECYWLGSLDCYDHVDQVLEKTDTLWADSQSRDVFRATLLARLTSDYRLLPEASGLHNQYFPEDVPFPRDPSRFVDCGAFEGDTLLRLHENCGTVAAIAAFEPDTENFRKTSAAIESHNPPIADAVYLWPCGVWSSTRQLRFLSKGAASRITDTGEVTIQCTSLDETIRDFEPSFIKMDVEGAEYEALIGATRLIQEAKPDLAICLYHRPDHLWQIPKLIAGWDRKYLFYLRQHGYNGFDLVLYATAC